MNPNGKTDDSKCDMLSACSDEELVARCQGGRLSAPYVSELIYRYFSFIKSKAAHMCSSPSSCDDLVQEGLLGFMSAIRRFDCAKGAKFSSFAYSCVTNRMKTAAARMSRLSESEEGTDSEEGEDNITPESIIISREFFSNIEKLLSPLEYSIFKMYISGLSCGEIAEKLGISRKSAGNAIQRARQKLRTELDGDNS